jgi:GxxExxY protein
LRFIGDWDLVLSYENALVIELRKRGLKVEQQVEVAIIYDEVEVGKHRLDLLVEDTIVVELKAIKDLEDIHFAIVKSYLKATGKEHGLLLNFAKVTLEVKRVIHR